MHSSARAFARCLRSRRFLFLCCRSRSLRDASGVHSSPELVSEVDPEVGPESVEPAGELASRLTEFREFGEFELEVWTDPEPDLGTWLSSSALPVLSISTSTALAAPCGGSGRTASGQAVDEGEGGATGSDPAECVGERAVEDWKGVREATAVEGVDDELRDAGQGSGRVGRGKAATAGGREPFTWLMEGEAWVSWECEVEEE